MFRQIKGQDKALKLLTNSIKHNRTAQSYIFHGPEGIGKFTSALYFGMALNCVAKSDMRPCGQCASCHKFLEYSHPDFIYIFPTPNLKLTVDGEIKETKYIKEYNTYLQNRKETPWTKFYFSSNIEIRKESIAFLQKKLEFSQREGKYRICIIEDADEMNQNTANSFLKTLEEPPDHTILILLTTKIQSLLSTVISRCQLIFFQPLPYKMIEELLISKFLIDKQTAKSYSRIANGNLEQAIRLANDTKHEARELMVSFVKAALEQDDMFVIHSFSTAKDKFKSELIQDLLLHLAIWFNDIIILQNGRKDIVSSDYLPLLEKCVKHISSDDLDFVNTLQFIDDLHRKLDGNVNVQLILINLYFHLKSLFNT